MSRRGIRVRGFVSNHEKNQKKIPSPHGGAMSAVSNGSGSGRRFSFLPPATHRLTQQNRHTQTGPDTRRRTLSPSLLVVPSAAAAMRCDAIDPRNILVPLPTLVDETKSKNNYHAVTQTANNCEVSRGKRKKPKTRTKRYQFSIALTRD